MSRFVAQTISDAKRRAGCVPDSPASTHGPPRCPASVAACRHRTSRITSCIAIRARSTRGSQVRSRSEARKRPVPPFSNLREGRHRADRCVPARGRGPSIPKRVEPFAERALSVARLIFPYHRHCSLKANRRHSPQAYLFRKNENTMSATMIQQIDSTTARVVARPTPSAPPLTEKPVLTPISVISTANTTLLASPCQMIAGRRAATVSAGCRPSASR